MLFQDEGGGCCFRERGWGMVIVVSGGGVGGECCFRVRVGWDECRLRGWSGT